MTDRIPLAQHTKASLDALYAENDRLTAELDDYDRQVARVETERTRAVQRADEAEGRLRHLQATSEAAGNVLTRTTDDRDQLRAERDGAYRGRAQLLALLASLHPSVIAPAPDVDEPGWQILYLHIGGRQASWHIAPRDTSLFAHVEHVPADDRRAQWDGHTTDEKYTHIGRHAARLYAEARGRIETPLPAAEQEAEPDPEAWEQQDDGTWTTPFIGGYAQLPARTTAEERARFMEALMAAQRQASMTVQRYREYGHEKWVFRCWGTDTCDGLVSLDHTSKEWAERARDRHVAEAHATPPATKATDTTKEARA